MLLDILDEGLSLQLFDRVHLLANTFKDLEWSQLFQLPTL